MIFGRRTFVAGTLAVLGAAAARPATAHVSPEALLLLDPAAPPAFRNALAASRLSFIDRRAGDISVLADSVAWLTARPGRRMVGLLGDADAVLLDQFTRDGAIRCLSSAQHCGSAGTSRHRITALSTNAGLGRSLANELAAAGTNFAVVSEPLVTPRAAVPLPRIPASAAATGRGWADALGTAMAMIAAGNWPARAPDAPGSFGANGARSDTFALRSFVFAS
nr:hypothetical protein [uncultured Rhodopila sp.]